jgi:hypothetical protein
MRTLLLSWIIWGVTFVLWYIWVLTMYPSPGDIGGGMILILGSLMSLLITAVLVIASIVTLVRSRPSV